jgi:TolA-binding protein
MRVVVTVLMWFAAASCLAQSIHAYKSVHADGTVSYSDTRPAAAESVTEVRVYQDSAATEQQGNERMRELNAKSKELEKQHRDEVDARRNYESRVAAARQDVSDAQRTLETTRGSKKAATPERIGLAEEHVRLAKQRLREVQSAGRSGIDPYGR